MYLCPNGHREPEAGRDRYDGLICVTCGSSTRLIEEISDETLAVYHILALAQQGRFEETIAQMIASAVLSSDGNSAILYDIKQKIEEHTLNLLMDAAEIWEGLLPGPPRSVSGIPELTTVNGETWADLQDANAKLERVSEILSKPRTTTGDAKAWEALREIEEALGGDPDAIVRHEPNSIDQYQYQVSIIIDPRIRHDESSDLIQDAQNVATESPLNLARHIWNRIDQIDKVGRWPAEELAAWISHPPSGSHWLMTWDQAFGLKALEEAEQHLEDQGLEDIYQGISDMMTLAGQEYVAGRE